jgi:acetate kinase
MVTVLALNAGSSSLKYALFSCQGESEEQLTRGSLAESEAGSETLTRVLDELTARGLPAPTVVGHRLVHGGSTFTEPTKVDENALQQLDALVDLAPLHLPPAIALLRAARASLAKALHVACFDTAFHSTLPVNAARLPLPLELHEQGIKRYGFHGISYEYVLSTLANPPPARLIVAHLGSGASMAAIQNRACIDTSMGLTPSGGFLMGSRSGDLDPGVLIHLARTRGYSADRLEQLVNHESGLKALAGSGNMADLVARSTAGDDPARSAIEQFCYAIKKQLGAYIAALGGVDALIFTGGIGENVPLVRELACQNLLELGIELDYERNTRNDEVISSANSRCQVRVVATHEDVVIARAAYALSRRVN